MELNSFCCQICTETFNKILAFKSHAHSSSHRKKMEEVFKQKIPHGGHAFLPYVAVMDLIRQGKHPLIGSCLLTLCFSPEIPAHKHFYLCHVCEEKFPLGSVGYHLSSSDHCSNYFSYTNPDAMDFSWIPQRYLSVTLMAETKKEFKQNGPGQLQMLHLPGELMTQVERLTYSEAMRIFIQHDMLLRTIEASRPRRVLIQTYQNDSKRKRPLLGMQHIIECACVGETDRKHYLCTLCSLTFTPQKIIRHILSFDHIFCYFREWHPGTLMTKESYQDNKQLASLILDLAAQTEEIHAKADSDIKRLNLEPDKFASTNFKCYSDALKVVESITKQNDGSSLIASITPGNKLESCKVSSNPEPFLFKVYCQDCDLTFKSLTKYFGHVHHGKHREILDKFAKGDYSQAVSCETKGCTPTLHLHTYQKNNLRMNQPAVGLSLVVTCLSTAVQNEPVYICFACEESFHQSVIRKHFESPKHLIRTLLYLNPWRLPFGWDSHMDMKALKSVAWEEEQKRTAQETMLKILDISPLMLRSLGTTYIEVMKRLSLQHSLLKRNVPQRETYRKLKQNERFPLLGEHYLVMYNVSGAQHQSTDEAFLCLLCERSLSNKECHAHVFSREHVATFLDRFHPGSINSSTDPETLLDLAKQAARVHAVSTMQIIKLDTPMCETSSYQEAISLLETGRTGKGIVKHPINPKQKLNPRVVSGSAQAKISQEVNKLTQGSEKQESTCSNEATQKETAMEVDTQMHGENAEKGDSKETCTPSGKESEEKGVQSSSVEMKKAGSETSQLFKDREVEGSVGGKQSVETTGICQSIKKVDETDFAEKQSKSPKDVTTQSKNCAHVQYKGSESKRPRNMSDDGENERNPKRQCSSSRQDGSNEEQQPSKVQLKDVTTAGERESDKQRGSAGCLTASSLPSQEQGVQLWQYIKRKSREPVIGLDAVIECNCQGRELLYLCSSCCLQIPEKNIVSHLTAAEHQKVYLMGSQKLPSPPEKDQALNIRKMAALFEQENGYGEAKVVELDEEMYNDIVEKSYKSAMQAVQHFQDDGSCCELSSTSAVVLVKPEDFSAAPHAQPEVSAATENLKVGGSEVKPVSGSLFQGEVNLPQVYSCKPTVQLQSETSENVKGNHHAMESSSQATTSRVLPDTTGKELKSESISTPSVGSSNWETPKYAVDSDCAIKSSNKPMTTPSSKCPVKKVRHTSDGSTSAEPTCSVRAAACSSTSSDPAPKQQTCAAATSSASSTTPKQTAAKAASSATSMTDCLSTIPKTIVRNTSASPTMAGSPQCENREVSVKTVHQRNSVGLSVDVALNVQKSEEHAASDHMVHIKPENLHTPTELSHFKSMMKPKESKPKVGIDQLIIVTCGEKKQVYCQMCSVRFLGNSHHLHSDKHKMNYMKLKCPGVITKSTELMEKTVALLADIDKDSGTCHPQMMAVKMDVYDQLRKLPDDKAVEYVKALKREKNSQVSSTSGMAEDLRLQVACPSPCEASSPNDENIKQETCEVDVQTPTTIKTMTASEGPVKSDEPQSCDSLLDCGSDLPPPADSEPHNQSQPQSPPQDLNVTPMDQCESNQDQTRLSTNTPVLENIKQETCEADVQTPTTIKTMAASEGPVKSNEPQSCYSLLDRGSDLPPPAEPHNQSQPRFNPEPKPQSPPQDPHVLPMDQCERNEDQTRLSTNTQVIENIKQETCEVDVQTPSTVKTMAAPEGPVKSNEPQSCDSLLDCGLPPPADSEPHNQSQPRFNPEPKPQSPPQDPQVTSMSQYERNQDQSHLWLTQLSENTPVIGRGSVWECRETLGGMLYICESCCKVVVNDICLHLVSQTHKINSLVKEYSNFLWFLKLDSTPEDKESLLQKVIQRLSKREDAFRITPRVILLTHSLFKRVRTAPFSNALEIVKTNQSRRVLCSPDSSQQLQQNVRQPDPQRGEPVPVERQQTPPCVTVQRCERSRPAAAEKPDVATTVSVKDRVKQTRASPQHVTAVSSEADSSHSPLPGSADPQISSQITCRALPVPAEIKPPVSAQLRSVPELQVKPPVVHSQPKPLPSSVISAKVIQKVSVSLKDERAPFARKRPPGTTDSTGTRSPQLKDPLPAKRTCSSQPPSTAITSKSMSVNPATSSTHLYSRDQDWRSRSNEMDPSGLNDEMVKGLLRLVKSFKSERKTSELSVPDNARRSTSTTLESCLPNSKAVSTTSSSVNTRPRDPRLQGGVNLQGSSENPSNPKAAPRHSEATCNPPSQKPQAQGATVCSTANLPINAIITTTAKLATQQSAQQSALSKNRAVQSEGSTSHQFPNKSQTDYTTIGQVSGYVLPQATKIYITHGNTSAQRNPQLRATNSEHLVTLVPQGTVRPVPLQQLLQQQWVVKPQKIQPQKIQPKQVQQQQRVKVSDFFFMEVEQQKQQEAIQQQQIQQPKMLQQPIQQQQMQKETQEQQPIQQQFQPQWLIYQQPTQQQQAQQQAQQQWLIQQQQMHQQQTQLQQQMQQQRQQLFQPEWQHYASWSKAAPAAGGTGWGAYLTTAPNNTSQEFLNQNVSMRSFAPVQSNTSVAQSVPWLPQTSGHLLSSDSQPSQHVPAHADSL